MEGKGAATSRDQITIALCEHIEHGALRKRVTAAYVLFDLQCESDVQA